MDNEKQEERMMENTSYRNELKYPISRTQREVLSRRLGQILIRDPHVQGQCYRIKSLYFDTFDDEALADNLLGANCREKYRIRMYNDDDRFIRLEKKVKRMNKGFKRSAPLCREEVEKILARDYGFLRDKEDPFLKRFYADLTLKLLQPKIIIVYDREPFLYAPGNVRVTLDFGIRSSREVWRFFEEDLGYLSGESPGSLLEVKYDDFLPDLIRDLVQGGEAMQTAHSKYARGRLALG